MLKIKIIINHTFKFILFCFLPNYFWYMNNFGDLCRHLFRYFLTCYLFCATLVGFKAFQDF